MGTIRPLALLASFCALVVCLTSGCQTTALRVSTTAQAQSVTEFYYQQVLQNLAYLHDHPEGLPFFSAAGQGQTSINDTTGFTDQLNWNLLTAGAGLVGAMRLEQQTGMLTASRLSTQLWTTQTTTAPDRLTLMRCAYLSVLGCNGLECLQTLNAFYGPPYSPCEDPNYGPPDSAYRVLHPGWCFICKRSCVPKWACKVAYCGDTAAWVPPGEGMQALAEFTKVILDMASAADGGHLEAQITTLRAKAKDLSELLKNDPLKPYLGTGGTAAIPEKVGKMNWTATVELQQEYVNTLIQLERAILRKQIALTTDPTLQKQLCVRLQALSICPTSYDGTDCPRVVPYSKPVLQPRLNLNLVPVYVNPPG
jgi:hypothetical protein